MDIFGKKVDPSVLEKISRMLKTEEGAELRNRLQKLDHEALVRLFSQMNVSQKDIEDISNKIKEHSQSELMNEILKKVGRI